MVVLVDVVEFAVPGRAVAAGDRAGLEQGAHEDVECGGGPVGVGGLGGAFDQDRCLGWFVGGAELVQVEVADGGVGALGEVAGVFGAEDAVAVEVARLVVVAVEGRPCRPRSGRRGPTACCGRRAP
ncbi:hypothetical protein C6V83_09560 [Gordonia iterans]|uniref:Uncharacterized protein n=1 Tax=Gordonia iterans TaxID=1004901 RepID=A0A2S0KFL3_9ACTN|nr:hypothetical protein C6V83_09560 [Gordonia iterans]